MKNFVAVGNTIEFTAAAAIASGEPVVIGTLIGIANGPVANGARGVANLTGVYDLAKAASQAWTVGAKVYWDATNKVATTTSSGNTLLGAAVLPVGSGAGEIVGRVRLNGVTV